MGGITRCTQVEKLGHTKYCGRYKPQITLFLLDALRCRNSRGHTEQAHSPGPAIVGYMGWRVTRCSQVAKRRGPARRRAASRCVGMVRRVGGGRWAVGERVLYVKEGAPRE